MLGPQIPPLRFAPVGMTKVVGMTSGWDYSVVGITARGQSMSTTSGRPLVKSGRKTFGTPMTFLNAASIVAGVAIVVNGFEGRSLWKGVEMPLTREEGENSDPPIESRPWVYIAFGLGLFACGVFGLFHP